MNYVCQCIKDEPKIGHFGLSGRIKYKRGDFISFDGEPVVFKSATVNTLEEYDIREFENLKGYFRLIPLVLDEENAIEV